MGFSPGYHNNIAIGSAWEVELWYCQRKRHAKVSVPDGCFIESSKVFSE